VLKVSHKIDVVIVNWNAGDQVLECVSSISQGGDKDLARIIVVDNGSTDGSGKLLLHLTDVQLIEAGRNLGFGKACNLGARHGNAKYILFLNPDAAVYPASLQKVLDYMERPDNQEVGVCGVQLKDEHGEISRSCTRFPTVKGLLAHTVGLDHFIPKLGHFMREWDHATDRSVDHVIGAFYLIRREIFDQLQGFDERFFVYLEDLDLSRRVKAKGWRVEFLSSVQAYHKGGGTSDKVKARRLFYSQRSKIIYSYKYFGFFGATLILLSTLLLEPLSRTAISILRGSLSSIKETWVAYGLLISWLPGWVCKGRKGH
jgi:GT2 family glycosyltransferase